MGWTAMIYRLKMNYQYPEDIQGHLIRLIYFSPSSSPPPQLPSKINKYCSSSKKSKEASNVLGYLCTILQIKVIPQSRLLDRSTLKVVLRSCPNLSYNFLQFTSVITFSTVKDIHVKLKTNLVPNHVDIQHRIYSTSFV